jgi:hypothetical protein
MPVEDWTNARDSLRVERREAVRAEMGEPVGDDVRG